MKGPAVHEPLEKVVENGRWKGAKARRAKDQRKRVRYFSGRKRENTQDEEVIEL